MARTRRMSKADQKCRKDQQTKEMGNGASVTKPKNDGSMTKFSRLDTIQNRRGEQVVDKENILPACGRIEAHLNQWAVTHGLVFAFADSGNSQYRMSMIVMRTIADNTLVETFATKSLDQFTVLDLWRSVMIVNAIRGRITLVDLIDLKRRGERKSHNEHLRLLAGPKHLKASNMCELVRYVPLTSASSSMPVVTNLWFDMIYSKWTPKTQKKFDMKGNPYRFALELDDVPDWRLVVQLQLNEGAGKVLIDRLLNDYPRETSPKSVTTMPSSSRTPWLSETTYGKRSLDDISTDSGRSTPEVTTKRVKLSTVEKNEERPASRSVNGRSTPDQIKPALPECSTSETVLKKNVPVEMVIEESDDDCMIIGETGPIAKKAKMTPKTVSPKKTKPKAKRLSEDKVKPPGVDDLGDEVRVRTIAPAVDDKGPNVPKAVAPTIEARVRTIAPADEDVVVELATKRTPKDWSMPIEFTDPIDETNVPSTSAGSEPRRSDDVIRPPPPPSSPPRLTVLPPPPPPPPLPYSASAPSMSLWDELPSNAVFDFPDYDPTMIPPSFVPRDAPFKWHSRIDTTYHDECVEKARRHERQVGLLTAHVRAHYRGNIQDEKTFNDKMTVLSTLRQVAQQSLHPHATMQAVGSTVNGCGAYCSDMDVCLRIPDARGAYPRDKGTCMRQLRTLERSVRKACWKMIEKAHTIPARVPIVKLHLRGNQGESMEVDINVNNDAGIYNSHLCQHYCMVDDRFPALVLLIKHWAITSNINDAMNGTFNSYSLVLLVVHYLQAVARPAVLPNLQAVFPQMFTMQRAVESLNPGEPFPYPPIPPHELNTQPLGELVVGFFAYYQSFMWSRYAISVRLGCRLERSTMAAQPNQKNAQPVFVEEPYDHMNTARSCRPEFFTHTGGASNVPAAFTKAHRILSRGGSLADIGVDCGI